MLLFIEGFSNWIAPADATLLPGPGKWTNYVTPGGTLPVVSIPAAPRLPGQPSLGIIVTNANGYLQKQFAATNPLTMGFWLYVSVADANENIALAQWLSGGLAGTAQVTLVLTPDMRIAVLSGGVAGTLIAQTASSAVALQTWVFVEMRALFNPVNGMIQIDINGAVGVVAPGVNTDPAVSGAADTLNFGYINNVLTAAPSYRLGELYVTNDVPPNNIGLLGPIGILGYLPAAAGTTTDFLPAPHDLANWDCVNDVPADGDGTYVSDNTTNDLDLYQMAAVLLPDTAQVLGIQVASIAKKAVAIPGTTPEAMFVAVSNVVRSGEVEWDSDGVNVTDAYAWYVNVLEYDPNTLVLFTPAAISGTPVTMGAQVGVKVALNE